MKDAGADYVASGAKDAVEAIANLLAGGGERAIPEQPLAAEERLLRSGAARTARSG